MDISKLNSNCQLTLISHRTRDWEMNGVRTKGPEPVVTIRNGYKSFGRVEVLRDFSMTVNKGTIYSLLGSSSSGKTTTLSCIAGTRRLNEGIVRVFGRKPGGIMGTRVGYMPQEISLYGNFSIAETLIYFGTLCGMNKTDSQRRIQFLTDLLGLPGKERRVETLSGGQRRRVSFAVSLIHEPDLLLLDEPTSGVDPLLRESMWAYLLTLTETKGTTILLTTHYIDEAKPSHAVGVMQNGQLIAEDSPKNLMEKYATTSLETVVLHLCMEGNFQINYCAPMHLEYRPDEITWAHMKELVQNSGKRIKALVGKNVIIMLRNLLLLIFVTLIPSIIIFLTCIAYQQDPSGLNIGVVNNDNICDLNLTNYVQGECNTEHLSCEFLKMLPSDVVNLKLYETLDDAVNAIKNADIWAYVSFPEEYSTNFYTRLTSGTGVDDEILDKSTITVQMDQSSRIVYYKIASTLLTTLEKAGKLVLKDCGYDYRQADYALKYNEPIFGNDSLTTLDYVAPSLAVAWLLFFPMLSSSIRFIGERKQGTLERSRAAGTQTWEILLAYALTEFIVLVCQSGLVFAILYYVFHLQAEGSPALIFLLTILTGFMGVVTGFLFGTLLNEEVEAALMAIAIFFPNSFIAALVWPKEGMPVFLQRVNPFLPAALAGESIRSLYTRGWEFTHPNVYLGYVSVLCYTIVFTLLTIFVAKFKANRA